MIIQQRKDYINNELITGNTRKTRTSTLPSPTMKKIQPHKSACIYDRIKQNQHINYILLQQNKLNRARDNTKTAYITNKIS